MMDIHEKKIVALIFIVALALRLIVVANLSPEQRIPNIADARQYDEIAINLLNGKGFVVFDSCWNIFLRSFRVPLYPLFLAFIYLIFGHNYIVVILIQCIMSALLCVIIFYIGKFIFDYKIGLLSAFILAIYQPYIFYSFFSGPVFLLSENLFTFLFALLILSVTRILSGQFNLKNNIVSGILMGLVILTRPIIVLFPLVLFAFLWYKNKCSFISTLKKTLPLLISLALVILPWTIRNCFVHKAFVPISTQAGFALFGGNNPLVSGGGRPDIENMITDEEVKQFNNMSEVERNKMLGELGIKYLFKNYKKIPKLFFKKILSLWDIYDTDYDLIGNRIRNYNIWYSVILSFSLFGIIKSLKSKVTINILFLISIFVYFSIIAMVFSGEPRFRYPFEQFLIIFASAGVVAIYHGFKNKLFSYLAIGLIIGINFLFYIYPDLLLNWARRLL